MSTGRSDTSSKRKRSTPQKFKSRKLFASSRHDILEQQPEFSRARDGGAQEDQLGLSKLPVTLQNKENMPEKCPNGSVTSARGRGRPKGSKNKTFPTLPTKVYAVREGKPTMYSSNPEDDDYIESPNTAITPHRGRGRPRGSTKVKSVDDDAPKRSRGRPKGSKNKKPSKATLLKMITGKKIGRGRPRKTPHETNEAGETLTPKRGRGRPKGSLNKTKSGKRLSLVSGSLEGKKRGRPKKIMLHHSTLLSLTPKRPRGRPRKKGSLEAVPSSQDRQDHQELAPLSESLEIKKRGRPKKIILHHFALKSLTPKRPRGRPRKKGSFEAVPSPDHHEDHHELKTSESNTEDEEDVDSEEDDGDDNDDDDDEK